MKKMMFLMVALLVVPAMAAVEITLVEVADVTAVDIVITATGADTVGGVGLKSLVAGLALNVSVGAGEEITSITNYMTTGVSVSGAEGYGIYMGNITFVVTDPDGTPDTGDETTDIDQTGSPVAPGTAPDAPGQLPGESCVLEFGGLFDVANANDAPSYETTLARITVVAPATITVTEEIATRGGIVNIGGTAPSSTPIMPPPTLVEDDVCYTGPDTVEWEAMGKPESWCTPTQCHADVDGLTYHLGFGQYTYVGPDDLTALVGAYRKTVGDPAENLACDFNHIQYHLGFGQYTRCGPDDLAILVARYRKLVATMDLDCLTATPVSP